MRPTKDEIAADFENLMNGYMRDRKLYSKEQDVKLYARSMVDKQVRGHQVGSKRWKMKVAALDLFNHFKLRRTYVRGKFEVEKRQTNLRFVTCNYFHSGKGRVYAILTQAQNRLYFFSTHFLDRLIQRHHQMDPFDIQRDNALKNAMDFFYYGFAKQERDPLLLGDDYEAHYMMMGGYAVGNWIQVRARSEDFPRNTHDGSLTVCFFKTFLSDREISEREMETMLEIYQRNNLLQDAGLPWRPQEENEESSHVQA